MYGLQRIPKCTLCLKFARYAVCFVAVLPGLGQWELNRWRVFMQEKEEECEQMPDVQYTPGRDSGWWQPQVCPFELTNTNDQ